MNVNSTVVSFGVFLFVLCIKSFGKFSIKNRYQYTRKKLPMTTLGKIAFSFSVPDLQSLVTQPPSQSNNLCFFKGFGEVVSPSSCDHYYACTNTRSIRMACPAGLHFRSINAEKGVCDYPRNVKCSGNGVRPNNDTSVVTTQSTTITTPVTETTKYHPKNIH